MVSRLDETANARAAQQVEQNSPELVVLITKDQMIVVDGWVDESIYDKKSDKGSKSVRMCHENSGASNVVKNRVPTRVSGYVRCSAFRLCITLWGRKWTVWPSGTIYSQKMA